MKEDSIRRNKIEDRKTKTKEERRKRDKLYVIL